MDPLATRSSFYKSVTSGKDQYAKTPASMYDLFKHLLGVGKDDWFDVCPPNPSFDGLDVPWSSPAFCNPPFKDLQKWFDKAVAESRRDNVFTLILFPFRTAARYMHHHIMQKRAVSKIFAITSRVRFETYKKDFPLPIALLCVGSPPVHSIEFPPSISVYAIPTYLVSFVASRVTMEHDALPTLRKVYKFAHQSTPVGGLISSKMSPSCIISLSSNLTRDVNGLINILATDESIEYLMVMIPSLFNGLAFRTLLPYASCVYLLSPQVSLNSEELEKKSFLGTVGILLHHPRKVPPTATHESVPGYVAFHRIAGCSSIDFVLQDASSQK
jgi:hypothetical protein